jgi:hypothetical protein
MIPFVKTWVDALVLIVMLLGYAYVVRAWILAHRPKKWIVTWALFGALFFVLEFLGAPTGNTFSGMTIESIPWVKVSMGTFVFCMVLLLHWPDLAHQIASRITVPQKSRLKYILFESEGALTELFLGLISLTWGLWVISPFWDAFKQTTAFCVMGQIAPEWVWGTIMTAAGILKVYAILSEQVRLKKIVFTLSIFLWSCISISFAASAPLAVGTAIYTLITIANGFCLWRNGGL